jgi:hypothetical protein
MSIKPSRIYRRGTEKTTLPTYGMIKVAPEGDDDGIVVDDNGADADNIVIENKKADELVSELRNSENFKYITTSVVFFLLIILQTLFLVFKSLNLFGLEDCSWWLILLPYLIMGFPFVLFPYIAMMYRSHMVVAIYQKTKSELDSVSIDKKKPEPVIAFIAKEIKKKWWFILIDRVYVFFTTYSYLVVVLSLIKLTVPKFSSGLWWIAVSDIPIFPSLLAVGFYRYLLRRSYKYFMNSYSKAKE